MLLYALLGISLFATVAGEELRFIALGDWGVNDPEQVWVAEAMDKYCGQIRCDFIVSLGDNFYGDYMNSSDDPRFDTHWRDIYTGENIKDLVWYISIGNHDSNIFDAELHQVEFAETEPRWYQPWLWYDFYAETGDDTLVHFVCVDTPSLLTFKHNVTEQRLWINETIENSVADWIIVFGHHPMFSVGRYPAYPRLHRDVLPAMEDRGADMYMCGHDHNMQHINATYEGSFDHVLNGAGGRGLYDYSRVNERYVNNNDMEVQYFGEEHGFTVVTIERNSMLVQHYTIAESDENPTEVVPVLAYEFERFK